MCGMAGGISRWLNQYEVNLIHNLFTVNILRGRWGSGICFVPEALKAPGLIRSQSSLVDLSNSREAYQHLYDNKGVLVHHSVIMGHARFPTSGGYTMEHQHPFRAGNIIGFHNGTMTVVAGHKVPKDVSDSKLLYDDISERGLDVALSEAKGSYALMFLDLNKQTLNFVRNAERPLNFAHYPGQLGSLFWSSEAEALNFVLGRESKLKPIITPLSPGMVLSLPMRPVGVIRPNLRALQMTPQRTGGFAEIINEISDKDLELKSTTEPPRYLSDDNAGKPLFETKKFSWVSQKVLNGILRSGCCGCHKPATAMQYNTGKLTWLTREDFLCQHCMATPEIANSFNLDAKVA